MLLLSIHRLIKHKYLQLRKLMLFLQTQYHVSIHAWLTIKNKTEVAKKREAEHYYVTMQNKIHICK